MLASVVTFNITRKNSAYSFTVGRTDYEDLWEHIQNSFGIKEGDEMFLYAIPNDYSAHVRLCSRLLENIFDSAEQQKANVSVNLKLYCGEDFITKNVALPTQTASQAPVAITQIPKASRNHGHQKSYKNQKYTKSSMISPDALIKSAGLGTVPLQSPSTAAGPSLTQSVPPQTSTPALAHIRPAKVKSQWASQIDQFNKNYLVSSSDYNIQIEANYQTPSPFEFRSGSSYSISLLMKATGTNNLGKEFTFCKIAGNGNPGSFNLPVLRPQVQRTISITVAFDGKEEWSYWAVKKETGEWIGTIVGVTILKIQQKLVLKFLEYSKTSKELEDFYYE